MAMILDAVVGRLVDELLGAVFEMKDKAVKFRPTLERLEKTLTSVKPVVNQIEELNRKLDKPAKETESLIKDMERGKELVLQCSSEIPWWNCCLKANNQEKLEALDDEIRRFFQLDMQAQNIRNGLETLVETKETHAEVKQSRREIKEFRTEMNEFCAEFGKVFLGSERVELRGMCSPPQPPTFTVGFNVPLNKLKDKLLHYELSVSVLTVTGLTGSGKTTLAQKFCWDDEVKGKFKENIFFVTFTKTPQLNSIVWKLYQHTGQLLLPKIRTNEDAVNYLKHLLEQIGKKGYPILLVLDDVWEGSESLVDHFVLQIPNYKILVTSRFKIRRFGDLYELKPLGEPHATNLFQHSASLNQSSTNIPNHVVKEIVRSCNGSPLALRVIGKSLSEKHPAVWHNRAKELSPGPSTFDSSNDVLACLQKSLDVLDPKAIECFGNLGLFPEDQRIPASALVDMWAELHNEDDASATEKIYELVNLNMADIFVTRKVASGTVDYTYHYVTHHGLLRELAIRHTSQDPVDKRNRLIIDLSGNNVPTWWTTENEYHIAARILSISTDEAFTSEWCNLQPTEVEALVLNLLEKKCRLPMFVKKMNKLKVLIITNYDLYPADIENFELLDHLSNLKRIRLENVSIPLLSKIGVHLKNLRKCSFFMCNVNEAFENCNIQVSGMLPNLMEMNFDGCNMVELPVVVSNIVSLKKLSITNCHRLSTLPEGIGKLVNLETVKLSSCKSLMELPDSVTSLHNLKFLNISDCISLNDLPNYIGKLVKLEKLNVRGCSRLSKLPSSIKDLGGLRDVVCDEKMATLWEPFTKVLSGLRIEVDRSS